MARKLQKLINYHTSGTGMPASGDVALGEIVVRHNNEKPELLIKKDNNEFATFIDSAAVESRITTLKTTLEGQVNAVAGDVTELSGGVATELAKYDVRETVENKIATAKSEAIAAASADTAAEITKLSDVYDAKGAAAQALADAKADAAELYQVKGDYEAAGAAAQALADAKTYADGLNTAMDKRVDALEVISGQSHTHSNKDVLDGITAEKVAAWDAAEANASAYTDDKIANLGNVYAAKSVVDKLVGSDTDKSVRTIANEELAKQLIPEGAQESLDTLQEIAAWIQDHPESVSEINANIASLSAATGTLHTNVEALSGAVDTKFASYATSADTAAAIKTVDDKFASYATSADTAAAINAVDGKFASYATSADTAAAIKTVDDKFASYATSADTAAAINAVDGKFASYANSANTVAAINAVAGRVADLEAISGATQSAIQEIEVSGITGVTVVVDGTTRTLDFTEMVIDCGDF